MLKVALLLFLFFTHTALANESVVMSGVARDKDNKVVYKEAHSMMRSLNGEITEIKTVYTNPEGKQIAVIESSFEKDPFIPDTTFKDLRNNETQELTYDKDKKIITIKITDKFGKTKSDSFERADDMVSGQGFHNYILRHFDEKKSDIKFIVLPKMDYYSFYFVRAESPTPGHRRFILKISSWVLRAVVKEIIVEYREKDKALTLFQGLTNIESDSRDSQNLKIDMTYPGEKND